MITARVDPKLKRNTEKILRSLGLSTTEAITLFFNQINLRKGLPFAVSLPNTITARAIEEALAGTNLNKADSVNDLFVDLES
jgi:DNA-damage-inducible protein J